MKDTNAKLIWLAVLAIVATVLYFVSTSLKKMVMITPEEKKTTDNNVVRAILKFIINVNEGGAKIVNDPRDSGGLTKYGISKKNNPTVDVANLTFDQAVDIYLAKYYKPIADLVDVSNIQLLYQVLDHSINAGPGAAKNLLKLYGSNLDTYKAARIESYKKMKQFSIYGKSWTNRVNRTFV